MRITVLVLVTYALTVLLGVLWRFVPGDPPFPDLVALSAMYLGLSARHRLSSAVLGAVMAGYLADLLVGSPRGLLALAAGIVCVVGHLIQGRLLIRGWGRTAAFSVLSSLLAGAVVLIIRALAGLFAGGLGGALGALVWTAIVTGLCGPLVFGLYRKIDTHLDRPYRHRDRVLGELIR